LIGESLAYDTGDFRRFAVANATEIQAKLTLTDASDKGAVGGPAGGVQ